MPVRPPRHKNTRSNGRMAIGLVVLVLGMVGLTFASVPLYGLFCSVTGYGGTTKRGGELPTTVLDREMKVQFNADVNSDLPWVFHPDQPELTVKIGQGALTSFTAKNMAGRPTVGMAVYNVTPLQVGRYFHKVQCFCFDEQLLAPGQKVDMPVYFYIDPAINDDPYLKDIKTVTLSYTFYQAKSDRLDGAIAKYYQELEKQAAYDKTHDPAEAAAKAGSGG